MLMDNNLHPLNSSHLSLEPPRSPSRTHPPSIDPSNALSSHNMFFITAPLMNHPIASSVGYSTRDSGLVSGSVFQSLQSLAAPFDVWMVLSLFLIFSLLVKVILSVATRLALLSSLRTRWLLVTILVLPVFATAFVFFPSDATHYLARQLPAAASLWSFIQYGIIEPAPIRRCFDKFGNLSRLLDPTKEALYLRCFDASAVFESPETTLPDYQLTCDYDSAYARLSCLSRTLFESGSSISFSPRLSWLQTLTVAVLTCLIVIVCKLYASTVELTIALEMREEASSVEAEYSRQERIFYQKRISTLVTANQNLIAGLESALPKITAADLQCAQARAHANQLDVAIDDLKDAHAADIRYLKTALADSESKAAKATAHARSLMMTTRAQRSTISAQRASSSRLSWKVAAQDDVISVLACEKEHLETMIHHLRIDVAELCLAVDDTVSDYDEEEVPGPYVDYEDFLNNFVSFKDSLCDIDEEADEEFSAAAEVDAESSPASVNTESPPPHTPSYDPAVEGVWEVDAQIQKICDDINSLKLSDSFLLGALTEVLAPFDSAPAPGPASDLSLFKMFDCPLGDAPFYVTATDEEMALQHSVDSPLSDAPTSSEQASASSQSSPSLFTPQKESIYESTFASPTPAQVVPPTSAPAPFEFSSATSAPHRMERLFEGAFGDLSLDFAFPQNLVSSCAAPPSLFTPIRSLPSPSPASDRQWLMYSPSCAAILPGTPECASNGKQRTPNSARRLLSNKENVMLS